MESHAVTDARLLTLSRRPLAEESGTGGSTQGACPDPCAEIAPPSQLVARELLGEVLTKAMRSPRGGVVWVISTDANWAMMAWRMVERGLLRMALLPVLCLCRCSMPTEMLSLRQKNLFPPTPGSVPLLERASLPERITASFQDRALGHFIADRLRLVTLRWNSCGRSNDLRQSTWCGIATTGFVEVFSDCLKNLECSTRWCRTSSATAGPASTWRGVLLLWPRWPKGGQWKSVSSVTSYGEAHAVGSDVARTVASTFRTSALTVDISRPFSGGGNTTVRCASWIDSKYFFRHHEFRPCCWPCCSSVVCLGELFPFGQPGACVGQHWFAVKCWPL